MRNKLVIILVLVAATAGAYGQVVGHGFVSYDDPGYVLKNPHVFTGLSWRNAAWAFTGGEQANWHPLTWLSLQLDSEVFRLNAGGYHVVNVLLHILSTVLLYGVLRRMTAAVWPSAAVAALFALHPLHVESVAWVAERKDVLSGLFWMLTLWAYAWYVERPGVGRYALVAASMALGLMAKPMLVTLPLVLLLLDWWPLGRLGPRSRTGLARLVAEKAPLFVLAAASSVVTFLVQQRGGTMVSVEAIPLNERMANAVVAYAAYLGKTVWPADLAVFYPHPMLVPVASWAAAALVLIAVTAGVLIGCRRRPYLAVGWLWYVGTLVPVIGIVQVGVQSMADRYTYIPLIGIFIMVVWGLADLVSARPRWRVPVVAAVSVATVACLVVTWVQVGYWQNSLTLLGREMQVADGGPTAHQPVMLAMKANWLCEQGRWDEAAALYREAIDQGSNAPVPRNNLAWLLATQADAARRNGAEAVTLAEQACAITHREDPSTLDTLAAAYAEAGRFPQAVAVAGEAEALARSYGQADLARAIRDRLALYKAGQPFHQATAPRP